jgi:dTDP-glucose pyrophosphorylase
MSNYKAIIPCAGFGTRMKMPSHEAKELIPDENGNPTIEWSLNICKKYDIEPIIVTRPEKEEFNTYLDDKNIKYVFDEGKSVGVSLLKSKPHWGDYNIILLPDTRFDYDDKFFINIFKSMKAGNDSMFALFNVTDYHNWGIICNNTFYEKPKRIFTEEDNAFAWGVISFTKEYGETLLNSYNLTSEPLILSNPGYMFIENFRDISRKYI